MKVIVRHGIGVVPGVSFYHACCFAVYLAPGPPERYGKVREYQNRATGFARLVSWARKLQENKYLAEGDNTPFRIVVLDDEFLHPLLEYLAELEYPIGDIDILTTEEVLALSASLGHSPPEGVVDAEFVARLSVERKDFIQWVEELGV